MSQKTCCCGQFSSCKNMIECKQSQIIEACFTTYLLSKNFSYDINYASDFTKEIYKFISENPIQGSDKRVCHDKMIDLLIERYI